ncbi:MAG: YtxH domain-containing protein [Chloroflexi bacterium SZAS-1]|jgi:gas vesicle protein|nr:YtxH domain-containing protein [Chloroflexi bacterium SZAS-1]HNP85683.1 YtxH domain-containing protein [Kouleothrix sp.]
MGRFLLGFAIGAAIGAASVILTAPRSGAATRQGIRGTIEDTRDTVRQLVSDATDVARKAQTARERELWNDFRARLTNNGS